ncbi:DMT family transporter [Ferruginibacter sp.]|uniref:DMT family transporter n=1 Tax=Ferruginibacter sp. TaxID=1940288 RepID=UPI002659CB57|nr:EamA family transporter [Ferruginibacter sp.]
MQKTRTWMSFVMIHVVFMGAWGALIELPEKNGFPATLGYVVWALTMIPATIVALIINKGKLDFDKKSVLFGCLAGFLGAIGQLVLFFTLRIAPAYIVFPVLSLTPVVTILLAVLFLKERTGLTGWLGIGIAVVAIFLLSYIPPGNAGTSGYLWILLTVIPLVAWGAQGFVMRFANSSMKAESIFFYMAISSVALIPIAIWMTDFSKPINYGFNGPYLAAAIQILNAFGALCLVYAFRYGKAIIIAPMTTALSPVLTVILSLIIYKVMPHPLITGGILLAIVSALLMGNAESKMEKKNDALADSPALINEIES